MNLLSYLSFAVFICYAILGINFSKSDGPKQIRQMAFLTSAALAIWAFTYSFLYCAPTAESAFFWHHLGAIGWSLFPAFVAHLFLILTNQNHFSKTKWHSLLFYTLPFILFLKNTFGQTTCVAMSFVQSTSGLGWTYLNEPTNIWTWIYIFYLMIYLGGALYFIGQWRAKSTYANEKKQALFFIVVVTIILSVGLFTDLILPFYASIIPPVSNILIALYVIGFFFFADKYQMFTFSNIASSDIILDTIMDPVILVDEHYHILKQNFATTKVLGYKLPDLIGKELKSIFSDKQMTEDLFQDISVKKKIKNVEVNVLSSAGSVIHANLSAGILEDKEHGFKGIVLTFHDITMRKKTADALFRSKEKYRNSADELFILANYDVLTRLPNRRLFFKRLEIFSQIYHDTSEDFALIFMDLNGFKQVNDNYGHDIGDLVLIEAAKRLEFSKTPDEFLSRIGGDEFTIIIPHAKSEMAVMERIAEIKRSFLEPLNLNELTGDLTISAGYSLFSTSENNIDMLIRKADQMMYEDKRKAKLN